MTVVGFDFGTTNSLISVVVGDRVINVVDPEDGLPFPSVVRYEGEQVVVGRKAKESLETAGIGVHGDTVLSPKTLLDEDSVYVAGVERSPVDIVCDVVRHVKSEALRSPLGRDLDGVTKAVVTIPVNMNGRRRIALRDAFRRADIGIAQFVHEPLAALYSYFRSRPDVAAALREYERRNVLVVDWGGGTLDLTLCRLNQRQVMQVRNSGSDEMGGDRFDEAIREGVIQRFCREKSIPDHWIINPDARKRILHVSEMHKIALSTHNYATFYLPGFFQDPEVSLEYTLTREAMQDMTKQLVESGLRRIRALLESAGAGPAQVAMCLVTGGMAAMPAIRSRLYELFGAQRVEIPEHSATLIAQGAAWIAHDKQRLRLAKTIELELARGAYLPLIRAGTEMPTEREIKKKSFQLYCCDPRDGSAKFQLCTPSRLGADVQIGDPREPLGTLVVQVDEKAQAFRERLELDLIIDDDMILSAQARSANVKDEDKAEFHDLEFSISLPGKPGTGPAQEKTSESEGLSVHRPGDLAVRSNLTTEADNRFVPGEFLYTYNPGYFNVALRPPKEQDLERLYYSPCAICGRRWNDPACHCASGTAS